MQKIFLFLAVALVLPLATAFDCQELNDGDIEICNEILRSSLSSSEKDLLIADVFKPTNTFPNHDFIYSWNSDLEITSPSNGIKENRGSIRNAWIEIIAPMPSVLENGTLYVPERGKLLSEYDYGVSIPSGRQRRDCKTKYYPKGQEETLRVFVNGRYVGEDKFTDFVVNSDDEDVTIIAELEIKVKYNIKHYRREDGRCRTSHYERITDTIKIRDTVNAKLLKSNPESFFKITNEYNDVTAGYLQANNFSALELSFANSLYQKTNYVYKLNYTLPYYVLTLEAEKVQNVKIRNINVNEPGDRYEFAVRDTTNCKIKLFSHFGSFQKGCDMSYSGNDFEIKTDKLNYHENETIFVEIFPKGVELNLTYANQSILARDSAEFRVVKNENKIIAQLNSKQAKKFINVTDEGNEIFLKQLSSISFFGYIVFSFLKKYYASFCLV